jgi:hypothetical protein
MVDIEVLNVDIIVVGFDDVGANEMVLGLDEVLGLVIGLISTPSAPTPSKSIATQAPQTQK